MEKQLQDMIDARIGQWGVTVQTVEMRDVVIPEDLQEAMSREAQAESEKMPASSSATPKSSSPNNSNKRHDLRRTPPPSTSALL